MAQLLSFDLSGIFHSIKTFLGPVGKLIDLVKSGINHVENITTSAPKLVTSIVDEINAWKNFREDIRFKSRVINLESAIGKTRDLITGLTDSWRSILDLFKTFKSKLTSGGATEAADEATSIVEDFQSAESGGLRSLLTKFPQLAKGLEKLLGILALVIDALETFAAVIDDVQTVVDEITRIRLEIEKLDTIFLSQSNKRKTLKLADGSSIRVRIGKLHS